MSEEQLPQIIADAKRKYGKVFAIEDRGTTFYFRPMSNADIKHLQSLSKTGSALDLEERLIEICVIYPIEHDYDKHSAGFVTSLCEEIRESSGWDDQDNFLVLIEEARNTASKVTSLIKAMILAAIPTYKPEDIDNMSMFKLTETLALAERILEIQRVEEPPKLTLQGEATSPAGANVPRPQQGMDPIAAKLQAGMAQAMAEAGVNPANLERPM